MLDYLIKNGLIVDGTNTKPIKSSVGILNKKIITDISDNSVAKEEIDAENKIVAPGFIDVHSHDDFKVISDPKVSHNILQGTNLSFNKKFYKDLNGYDEEYIKTGGGGDVDFWYRIYCKVLENNISVAYLVNASQRVRGKSTRKKDRVKARLYTMQKHNITNKSKMYKWFPEIRQKNNWMQLVND